MSLLLHIIVTYIKENITTKLQKLYSPPRNPRAGNKMPALFVKKNLFARAIYRPRAKYSLKGLYIHLVSNIYIMGISNILTQKIVHEDLI